MKTIYLANPYGFSAQQRNVLLPDLITAIESLGNVKIHEPFEEASQTAQTGNGWAYRVGQLDVQGVIKCDGFFGVVNGCPPDEGVMVELGIAIVLKKPIFLFRDDWRRCTDSEEYPLNLMLFAGLPEHHWRDYYYTLIEDLSDETRPLYKWINNYFA